MKKIGRHQALTGARNAVYAESNGMRQHHDERPEMRLFFDPSGPMLTYRLGLLEISDLNPEMHVQWRMTRWEMFKLGMRCLLAVTFAP